MTQLGRRCATRAAGGADVDPGESAEWIEALEAVIRVGGTARTRELLGLVFADLRRRGMDTAGDLSTPYVNPYITAGAVTPARR